MKYSFAMLAAAAAVQASPFPQAVTMAISPSGAAPSGCMTMMSDSFGIAVMNVTSGSGSGSNGAVADLADGQVAASTTGAAPVATIGDGQPQASTGVATPVKTIADGQPQAPTATAVKTIADGQPQAPTATAVKTIADGQPQAPTGRKTMTPINQISDGQIQQQRPTMTAVKTIADGQPQAPTGTAVKTIADGQPQAPTGTAVKTIADGQPQAPTGTAVKTIADGQPQAPTGTAVKTIGDGQPQAPTGTAVKTIGDGQPQASGSASASGAAPSGGMSGMMAACKQPDSLTIKLANGVLTDNQGRTGYIAANYQFQFDGPPQAGAIYTAGFSVCGNGSLALGGSAVFYQCLSGDFYNLYDRNWAPQCNAITINAVELVDC